MVRRVAGPNVARESAPSEFRQREDGGFVDRCGGNFDRVLQAFGIGKRDEAGARGHGF
jgi:hypothetical protein